MTVGKQRLCEAFIGRTIAAATARQATARQADKSSWSFAAEAGKSVDRS